MPGGPLSRPGGELEFVFRKNKEAADLTFTVEWSDAPAADSWAAEGVGAPVLLSEDENTQQLQVTVPTEVGTTSRFVRLTVSGP